MLTRTFVVLVCVGVFGSAAMAVTIETVPVGNVGNTGEVSGVRYGGWGLVGPQLKEGDLS